MAAQHAGLFMFLWIIGSLAAGDSEEMKAKPGQDVTLQCNGPTDAAVTVLEWKRPELEEDYVFFFRDNELIESFQDPRYRGRVQLKDPEMKNGDASVLLKKVDIEDTGTYKCRVITQSNDLLMRVFERSVLLVVSEGPEQPGGPEKEINDEQPGGPGGHVVSVLVCFLVGLGVGVGVVVVRFVVKSNVKRPLESFDEEELCKMNTGHFDDLLTPDCSPSPASKLNNPLGESLPYRGRGATDGSGSRTRLKWVADV